MQQKKRLPDPSQTTADKNNLFNPRFGPSLTTCGRGRVKPSRVGNVFHDRRHGVQPVASVGNFLVSATSTATVSPANPSRKLCGEHVIRVRRERTVSFFACYPFMLHPDFRMTGATDVVTSVSLELDAYDSRDHGCVVVSKSEYVPHA